MDCGPAVLTSILRGHGLAANLEAVRDLCATGVDGTSIDVIESLAVMLGLSATQRVVPADHLVCGSVELLPAIVVTELPDGLLHFVVAWRRVGPWVEVMDPAVGRRWIRWHRLRADLFRHEMSVPSAAWRDYAGSERFCGPLREQLEACGFRRPDADRLIDSALTEPGWESIARLDAAARRGARLEADPRDVVTWATSGSWDLLAEDSMVVPPDNGSRTSESVDEVVMRGAVVVSIAGTDDEAEVPAAILEQILAAEPSPARVVADVLGRNGILRLAAASLALAVGAGGSIGSAHVLRRLIDVDGAEGWRAVVTVGLLLFVSAAMSCFGTSGVLYSGRWVEIELRRRIEDRLGRFPDRFFASRPASDLAERAHGLHRLRDVASSASELCLALSQLVVATIVLLVVVPAAWWTVILLVSAAVVVPTSFTSALVEREHRSQTIAGAMSHSYLDALVGALPVRAHRAGRAVTHEHAELLHRWSFAELARHRVAAIATGATHVAGYVCAALVIIVARSHVGGPTGVGLVAFAAYVVVTSGVTAAATVRRLAPQWVITQRMLALSEVDLLPGAAHLFGDGPVGIDLMGVRVDGDRTPLLDDVSLSIRPGEHVTVVGPSGAGKSTLVATLLGWVTPDDGTVLVDGVLLDQAMGVALRGVTAWVDPDLAIWSGTLTENIDPRADLNSPVTVDLAAAGLETVAQRLDEDGSVGVGEDGRLLSGGEAQRVRIARALSRVGARLVVLDEADRGLDPKLRDRVRASLTRQFDGVTTITVTHDLRVARTAERVIVIDGGRVVADGAPAALLSDETSALARMIVQQEALEDSLCAVDGWGTTCLHQGRLVMGADSAPAPVHASALLDSPAPVENPQQVENPQPRTTSPAAATPPSVTDLSTGYEPESLISADRSRATAGLVLTGLTVMAVEWIAFVTGWAAVLRDRPGRLWLPLLVLAGVAAGVTTFSFGLAGTRFSARLRRRLLLQGITAPLDRIRSSGSGDLMGRVLEAESFQQYVVVGGTDLVMGVAQLIAALAVAAVGRVSTGTAVLIVVWAIGLILVALAAAHARLDWTLERIDRTRLLLSRFRGRRTESVYGPPPRADSRHLHDYWQRSCRSDRWKAVLLSNADVWLAVAIMWTLVVSSAERRAVSFAAVVLAWGAFSGLGVALDELASASASARSFRELDSLSERGSHLALVVPGAHESRSTSTSCVMMNGVGDRRDASSAPLFEHIDWRVAPGARIVLRGESGSGKSTLAQILAGIRSPCFGTVIGSEGVVYVPQFGDNHVMQASLAFNLLLARGWLPTSADIDDVQEVLEELDLGHVVEAMPRGIVQPIGEAGWQLSHGERARLHLARALLQDGHTIVMDETLEGLDAATARMVLDAVVGRYQSVVLIDHR